MAELIRLSLEEANSETLIADADELVRAALKEDTGGRWSRLRLPLLGEKVRGEIDNALSEIDPMELFAQAWSKVLQARSFPRDKTSFVEIGECTFEKDLHPVVTVAYDPWISDDIRFILRLSAQTNAVEVEVYDRHIVAAGGGNCRLGMELMYGKHSLSGPVQFQRYDLPGEYRFKGAGVPI
jgi:hypothetical protein